MSNSSLGAMHLTASDSLLPLSLAVAQRPVPSPTPHFHSTFVCSAPTLLYDVLCIQLTLLLYCFVLFFFNSKLAHPKGVLVGKRGYLCRLCANVLSGWAATVSLGFQGATQPKVRTLLWNGLGCWAVFGRLGVLNTHSPCNIFNLQMVC